MINKILRLPEKIPADKRLHFMLGNVFIAIEVTILLIQMGLTLIMLLVAFIGLCVFAWSIELYQKITKSGQYDNMDALAVVIGGVIGMLPLVAVIYL